MMRAKRPTLFLVIAFVIALALTFAVLFLIFFRPGLNSPKTSTKEAGTTVKESPRYRVDEVSHVCAKRSRLRDWCSTDFVELKIYRSALQGRKVYILGYLAIDDGTLTLYQDEMAYLNTSNGMSLEIRGSLSQLKDIFSRFGYGYVRIEGTFDQGLGSVSDRIGILHPPFRIVPVRGRALKETVNDIGAHVSYLDPNEARKGE